MPKYIITGGPGAGKTSLLQGLHRSGYPCQAEASRQLIIEEKERDSGCLPWLDLPCFAGKVLQRMVSSFDAAGNTGPVFFDRGIPDIIAYLRAAHLPVGELYHAALERYRYAPTVFLLPPWEEIYIQDSERWQTFAEAAQLADHIWTVYRQAGYQVVALPLVPVQQRIIFIQDTLSALAGKEKQFS
ncbi:AAA family ATPase [Flavitalea sp. BT771]|uniref:AAA family ATPase n=1 Tax=Flavitalea sp. BT771 TaxID=3063329 RepID=UPI0026E4856C|nr:AAA family ATPase [Flavitalea sp. BT771]MDO6434093.1 AAA family ATPase [Flavitalea sp. BT771]MDV6222993.1 AAA family ATPase [Flavitalea sp. BT771]